MRLVIPARRAPPADAQQPLVRTAFTVVASACPSVFGPTAWRFASARPTDVRAARWRRRCAAVESFYLRRSSGSQARRWRRASQLSGSWRRRRRSPGGAGYHGGYAFCAALPALRARLFRDRPLASHDGYVVSCAAPAGTAPPLLTVRNAIFHLRATPAPCTGNNQSAPNARS